MGLVLREKDYESVIGKLVKKRKELGLKQIDVATNLKVHQSEISRIETGETQIDILQPRELCKLYGVKLDDILEN